MSRLRIRKQGPVEAQLQVQGSKNGSLPCLAAALLHKGITVLQGVPRIEDVMTAIEILRALGARVSWEDEELVICAAELSAVEIPDHYMRKMRSSVIFMGALLARMNEAQAVYPGGCVLGKRPIDFHLKGFEQLGCQVKLQEDRIRVTASSLEGTRICLPFPSVGATENLLLAAAGAKGVTIIENAAREPEILELSLFMRQMGFQVCGAGSPRIAVFGREQIKDGSFLLAGDRIVAGTWLLCCMNAGGELLLRHAPVSWMKATLEVLRRMGARMDVEEEWLCCRAPEQIRPLPWLETAPYPGFPTDMQSQLLPVLCRAEEDSCICETVFSSRFRVTEELNRMGAQIAVDTEKNIARIHGGRSLSGACVTAPDLRGAAALVIAAMRAEGDTVIDHFYHMERGYEKITDKIQKLGGETCWID